MKTNKSTYTTRYIINAAGAHAKEIGKIVDLDIPVEPESHEAGITEPVKNFFTPMIVDIRPYSDSKCGDSKNYYFYQNKEGKQHLQRILNDDPLMKLIRSLIPWR